MKRIWLLFLCICLPICFCVTAFAADHPGDIGIDTVVPFEHTIKVKVTGRGSVFLDDADVGKSITVARHGDVTLTFAPSTGYTLSKIIYNDVDVTDDVLSNSITFKYICSDGTLKVVFKADTSGKSTSEKTSNTSASGKTGNTPKTGDHNNLFALFVMVCASLGILLVLVKKCYPKGNFD